MKALENSGAIEQWLAQWFAERKKIRPVNGSSENLLNTDYFEAGWLSSMEVVEFVTDIERQFDIQFSDRDLQDRRFVTIAGLAQLIFDVSSKSAGSN